MTRGPSPAPGTGGGPRQRHRRAAPSCKCTVLLCSLAKSSALWFSAPDIRGSYMPLAAPGYAVPRANN